MLILILAILMSLCVGLIMGGTISNLSRMRLRYVQFVFLAVFIQVLIFSPFLGITRPSIELAQYSHRTLIIPLCVMLMESANTRNESELLMRHGI